MPLITTAQFPNLVPDLGRAATGFAQGQQIAGRSQALQAGQQQFESQQEQDRIRSVVDAAAQLKTIPSTGGKLTFLNTRIADLESKGVMSDDSREIRDMLFQGRVDEAESALDKTIQFGQQKGLLKAPAAGPAPQIKQGLGPSGDPGFFAVTPTGAKQIPGITPAPKGPLVTIAGDEAVSEEKKAIAKIQAQNFKEVIDAGRNAESTLETLNQLDAIDIETGALEPLKAGFAAVVEGFGVDASAIADVTTAQALGAVSNRMVNDVLNAAKGPQTEGDAQRAKKTIRQLGDDPLAGQFKSDSLRALALRKVEQADFVADQISDGKTFTKADKAWREFKKRTPNLSEVIKNPETGLPIFFYQFKQNAQRVREGITDQEIIEAWRQAHAK